MSEPSPLTPNERSILLCLAVGAMAERTGTDTEAAEEHLNNYTVDIKGDHLDVFVGVAGQVLVRAPRAWLAEIACGE